LNNTVVEATEEAASEAIYAEHRSADRTLQRQRQEQQQQQAYMYDILLQHQPHLLKPAQAARREQQHVA
jgi:hypothetical protein